MLYVQQYWLKISLILIILDWQLQNRELTDDGNSFRQYLSLYWVLRALHAVAQAERAWLPAPDLSSPSPTSLDPSVSADIEVITESRETWPVLQRSLSQGGDVLWWEIRKFYYPITDLGVWLNFSKPEAGMINWYTNKEKKIWSNDEDFNFAPVYFFLPCCQFHLFSTEDKPAYLQRVLKPHGRADSHYGI